jgi:hAT family C-terminal dimerisation region
MLQHWQSDGTHYPTLQYWAIKVFLMLVSSAASEECFFNSWICSFQTAK